MKIGIFYYSKTGKNKELANILSKKSNSEMEEIVDKKNRNGILGFLRSGFDAFTKKLTEINNLKLDPSNFDHIIIGTPVWAGNITPAIRTFLIKYKESIKNYSVISVSAFGEKNLKIVNDLEKILNKKPNLTLFLSEKDLKKGDINSKIENFVEGLIK